MFGKNPKRGLLKSDGNILEIQEIFPTIQGEGPNAGMPAIFIRLGGCNLACEFCDTEFESYSSQTLNKILDEVKESNSNNCKLAVITGGEPFRQPIENLCEELIEIGFKVQIETNGTIYRDIPEQVEIICSPKKTELGYQRIREDLLKRINAFKFIISKDFSGYNSVPEIGQSDYNIPVYVQPMDEYDKEKNLQNMEFTKDLSVKNNYLLSIQLHKILGIR